jgi:hypothetical protein
MGQARLGLTLAGSSRAHQSADQSRLEELGDATIVNQPSSFEQGAQRTLDEITRSCRAVLSRAKALAKMSGDMDPLGAYHHRARSAVHFLESAMQSLEPTKGFQVGSESRMPAASAMSKCVDHLIDGLANATPGAAPIPGAETKKKGFSGTSSAIAVPELIAFLGAQQKTGVLEITTLSETFVIGFRAGEVIHASSDNTPAGLRLGEILVAQGVIDQRLLFQCLGRINTGVSGSGVRLGQILERDAGISREQLRAALEHQVQQLFVRLFTHSDACYAFFERPPSSVESLLAMNAMHLLLESSSTYDKAIGEELGTANPSNPQAA